MSWNSERAEPEVLQWPFKRSWVQVSLIAEKSKGNTSINSLLPRVHNVWELSAFGCTSEFAPSWRTHTPRMFSSSASWWTCGTKMRSDGRKWTANGCYSASSAHRIQFVGRTKPEPISCVMQVPSSELVTAAKTPQVCSIHSLVLAIDHLFFEVVLMPN